MKTQFDLWPDFSSKKAFNDLQRLRRIIPGVSKASLYFLEALPLFAIDSVASGFNSDKLKLLLLNTKQILPKIWQAIEHSHSPAALSDHLDAAEVFEHGKRLIKIYREAYEASLRRKNKNYFAFNDVQQEELSRYPDYYKRNFHFQNNGYLTGESAELYDHQVEILFSGTAELMRKSLIPHLQRHFGERNEDLNFLELGCGTGALTRWIAEAFPKAKITAIDWSSAYLNKAKENFENYKNIEFKQMGAEKINLDSEKFDAVFSCFLFHELPENIREQVGFESSRVLRPGGFFGFVDSLQTGDVVDLDWALEQFPKDFHEPFYKNYLKWDFRKVLKENKLQFVCEQNVFLSKVVIAKKIEAH